MSRKVILIVIDGWGHNEEHLEYDAVKNADTPWMDLFVQKFPSFLLYAHGLHVGLPDNQMGNSEVGHLTIGSGRVIMQDIVRINNEISQEKMSDRMARFNQCKKERIHIVGLLSDGGVHSHIDHIKSLIRNLPNKDVLIHAICDGRDTAPSCFIKYARELNSFCSEIGKGKIVSIAGRFYTMDRDNRDERTEKAFIMMTEGNPANEDLIQIVEKLYAAKQTDEFIEPTLLCQEGRILEGEPIIFANFRADRMRQIVRKFEARNRCFTLTGYDPNLDVEVIFEKQSITNCLSEVLSLHKINHLHIAETEKYAHVTYFFNGGNEVCYPHEDRIVVPSPKVLSYDLDPKMSVEYVVTEVLKGMHKKYGFIVCNLAPPDMVGHTGNYESALEAVASVDRAIGFIYEATKTYGYTLFIVSDHGNAEIMKDREGNIVKKHTKNRVPFIICDGICDNEDYTKQDYSLKEVAPTILGYMGISIPEEMTGQDLTSFIKPLK